MKYVGLYSQQRKNNLRSTLLLLLFPAVVIGLVLAFSYIMAYLETHDSSFYSSRAIHTIASDYFISIVPWAVAVVGIWFVIAYFANTSMIRHATKAKPLERKENPRVYNIVENLTMTCGMDMPEINIINSPELNAFASGIDRKSYTVTVTTGLCDTLDDEELAGVIGHELTHIRNRDTRLLIVSIVFVGIMAALMSIALRILWNTFLWGGGGRTRSRNSRDSNGGVAIIVIFAIAAVLAALGYFFTLLTRFAISRKREYMADAGGAELCGNPLALASALRKISEAPYAARDGHEDVQQLFIIQPMALKGGSVSNWFRRLFSTHPSTESRIAFLEQL
ncbi:MAG: M48 family metallopeptidase [Bacteroidaceae bacterium]|nr:M48 family metallopeptidase [Bacteroidaceae bacterium]